MEDHIQIGVVGSGVANNNIIGAPTQSSSSSSLSSSLSSSAPLPQPPPQRMSRRTAGAPFASVPNAAANDNEAAAPARVVPRPPLDEYLQIAIVRDRDDAIVCEDPERPGETKTIVVNQLLEKNGGQTKNNRNSSNAAANKKRPASQRISDAEKNQSKKNDQSNDKHLSNKKEIPVPTITVVRRYDADVPPDYAVPNSYLRNIPPTFEEVLEGRIDYNLDAEDERWWRANGEFGPFAKARIITGDDEGSMESENQKNGDLTRGDGTGAGSAAAAAEALEKEVAIGKATKERSRNKRGKFVKKNSSKNDFDDVKEDAKGAEEVDVTNADDASAPSNTLTVQQVLLLNPKYLHSQHSTQYLLEKCNPKLPLSSFEQIIDILEKATGFESIVTNAQAEEMLARKMPVLVDIFGPLSAKERLLEEEEEEKYLARWLKTEESDGDKNNRLPTLAQPIILPAVIDQVYNYWMAKRSKLKKPLLRRYWPPTAATDTNPHQVFRQPSKAKRRLRKKKQNSLDAFKKMKQLKLDFERVKVLCELILQRENVHSTLVELTNEYFEERMHGWMESSGAPRRSQLLNKRKIEDTLSNMPKYFDNGPIVKVKGGKKRKRSTAHMGLWNGGVDSRNPSPVPFAAHHRGASSSFPGSGSGGGSGLHHPPNKKSAAALPNLPHEMKQPPPLSAAMMASSMPPPPKNVVVAGHDGGFPAPNFLQPLASRESHPITTWEDAVPSMPSYINGEATTQSSKFRHRPRLGRGGRIVIDRVPLPSYPSSYRPCSNGPRQSAIIPSPAVITYGSGMERSSYHIASLGTDGPNYSCPNTDSEEGTTGGGGGTNAASAPKAPPAQCLSDLLPKPPLGGDPTLLSRRLEEICAQGLIEDYQTIAGTASSSAYTAASLVSTSLSSKVGGGGGSSSEAAAAALGEEMDEMLVPMEDWMDAPEGMKIYGAEKFVIGPL